MKIFFLILILISTSAMSATLSEKFIIKKIQWQPSTKMYRLGIYGKAGVYYSPPEYLKCLKSSIDNKLEIKVSYNSTDLKFISCKYKEYD